jgi:hypothetical protein
VRRPPVRRGGLSGGATGLIWFGGAKSDQVLAKNVEPVTPFTGQLLPNNNNNKYAYAWTHHCFCRRGHTRRDLHAHRESLPSFRRTLE